MQQQIEGHISRDTDNDVLSESVVRAYFHNSCWKESMRKKLKSKNRIFDNIFFP